MDNGQVILGVFGRKENGYPQHDLSLWALFIVYDYDCIVSFVSAAGFLGVAYGYAIDTS
jgi:hypothetical protein